MATSNPLEVTCQDLSHIKPPAGTKVNINGSFNLLPSEIMQELSSPEQGTEAMKLMGLTPVHKQPVTENGQEEAR
jgi:hypothetical protein